MGKDLTNKLKKRKSKGGFRKWFLIAGLGLSLIGCPLPGPNQAPETKIERQYKDDGTVEYTFSGIDEDGSVDYISVNVNGSHYQDVNNNSYVTVPIVEGGNTVTATAVDNEGAEDPTPATGSFNSPTEYEASQIVSNILNPNTYNKLEENVSVSLGSSNSFTVNNLISKLNGTDAIIDYMGTHGEDLDLYGIPNICPKRTSVEKLEEKALAFQNNGYN